MNINERIVSKSPTRGDAGTVRPSFWRRAAVAAVALAAIGAVLVFAFSGEPTPPPTNVTVDSPAENDGTVMLSPAQREAGGIVVEAVTLESHAEVLPAPGEVRVNDYATSNVSSRLRASVLSRHARLGDRIRIGQALVTLYSADMAEAQSTFVLASKSFARMSNLKGYISGQQYDEAEVKRDEARGRLETFGLGTAEIAELALNGLSARPAGQFDLTAPQAGVVTTDAFRLGEVVEPGKTLFEISNLSAVWVEAQVNPEVVPRISGTRARVLRGADAFDARIIQTLAQLSETTRTVGIRLQMDNPGGALRPGEFVNVQLFGEAVSELIVPTASVLRDTDGSWLVYVENAQGALERTPVQPLHAAGERTAISGITEGTKVVVAGAFFVKSEADKASFGEEE